MAVKRDQILVINSGSATLKFKIFDNRLNLLLSGIAEKIGRPGSFIEIDGKKIALNKSLKNHGEALNLVFSKLAGPLKTIGLIGHRVVHGGEQFNQPALIDDKVLARLEKYRPLAPLHNPINLACVKACQKALPGIKNAAVFDTAFYKTIPDYVYLYAIPYKYYKDLGVRRYGFHGISHQFVAQEAARILKKPLNKLKLITCHLGSGCSITATKFGQAVETSMGFTPLEGLTMGTRSGDLDPAVAFYLMRRLKLNIDEMEAILNKKSGLLGIFGYSNDLRDIIVASGYKISGYQPPKKFSAREIKLAKLALKMFIYDIVRYIGAYAMILGGVDYIVFTAGTGERNADIRNLVMKDVRKFIKNAKSLVVPTNEELMIARLVRKFSL